MFLPKKRAEDEAEDRNAAKQQLKKALYRRVVVSAYRRRSRMGGLPNRCSKFLLSDASRRYSSVNCTALLPSERLQLFQGPRPLRPK